MSVHLIMIKSLCIFISFAAAVQAQWWKPISNNPAINPKAPPLPAPATGGTAVGDSNTPTKVLPTSLCGRPTNSPDALWATGSRIVGGVEAQEESWPWIVALIQFRPEYMPPVYQFCGASLISDRWIVTAGHCVDNHPDDFITTHIKAVVGITDLKQVLTQPELLLPISRVFHHPDYDNPKDTTNNDVALLELAQPVKFTSRIQPICLPTHPSTDVVNAANIDKERDGKKVAFVAGWGHLVENQGRTDNNFAVPILGAGSDKLEQVAIGLYDRATCVKQLEGFTFTEAMICGGFPEGGKDSCQGDSGGPLVAKDKDGHHELIGVVSWGKGCAQPGVPGIYSNVFYLKNWIESTIANATKST
ncbi:transmembrane protease serine 9-like [Paramacrobiotus metropolitanus]|uniref:transmembrane protease serine 9-like n=1 Tax=Paramacrobiotus metropolitanus TaxID=2943436 RepID=UPI002445BED8|nr:transmembrane protease serine 9-like [Paramacrobiotus metropolitanus]